VAHLSIAETERYALQELSEAEMRRVEKHVARCQKYRDLDEELGWAAAMRSPFMAKVPKSALLFHPCDRITTWNRTQ
jgi:hypothetical protein